MPRVRPRPRGAVASESARWLVSVPFSVPASEVKRAGARATLGLVARRPRGRVDPRMPQALGPYDLTSELGAGGAGRVYRAIHRPTGVERAVKVLNNPRPATFERFRREVTALASLGGEGVVSSSTRSARAALRRLVRHGPHGRRLARRPAQEARELPLARRDRARASGRASARALPRAGSRPPRLEARRTSSSTTSTGRGSPTSAASASRATRLSPSPGRSSERPLTARPSSSRGTRPARPPTSSRSARSSTSWSRARALTRGRLCPSSSRSSPGGSVPRS